MSLLEPSRDARPVVPSVQDAVRSSPVAAALKAAPSRSAHELAGMLDVGEDETLRQLSALKNLEMADRDDRGRWALTERGEHVVQRATEV